MTGTKYRFTARLLLSFLLTLIVLLSAGSPGSLQAATTDPAFESTWQRIDLPVATQTTQRGWFWAQPLGNAYFENYTGAAPYGRRMVQYFEKGRLETTVPGHAPVTSGLLVAELISGRIEIGENSYQNLPVASIAALGDADNLTPTYSQLKAIYNKPAGDFKPEQPVVRNWADGRPLGMHSAFAADSRTWLVQQENGFGIPQIFWSFMNSSGKIKKDQRYVDESLFDWHTSVGLPLSEAYWTRVKIGGEDKNVMFQIFERRILTFTPSNPEPLAVESNNAGVHYVQWRFGGKVPEYAGAMLPVLQTPNLAPWYEITAENEPIRVEPSSKAPQVQGTRWRPILPTVSKGNRVQPIRAVPGEELQPGNNIWFQIYENPGLYIYSGYSRPLEIPAFPALPPNKAHQGLWVAVSLQQQMMAIFKDDQLVYRTLISSGKPGMGTVTGSFQINGEFRPDVQTMSASWYRLEEIRNVNYFYRDYAIHGSYWTAQFGQVPISFGCVNATDFDAGLVFSLPAGTWVEVF